MVRAVSAAPSTAPLEADIAKRPGRADSGNRRHFTLPLLAQEPIRRLLKRARYCSRLLAQSWRGTDKKN